MAQHIDNLRGEQGGQIIGPDYDLDSFDSETFGEAQVLQAKVLSDETTLSGVTMPDVIDGGSFYDSATLDKNDFIDGKITAATVTAGAIQVFLHKKSTASA